MRDPETFTTPAAECRVQADAAGLANVRERCLRSKAPWLAMANRSRRTEITRDAREIAAEAARNAAASYTGLTSSFPNPSPSSAPTSPERTTMDLNCLLHRHQVALARAAQATEHRSRYAHLGLARGYADQIARVRRELGATGALIVPA